MAEMKFEKLPPLTHPERARQRGAWEEMFLRTPNLHIMLQLELQMNFFAHLKESVDLLVKHLVNWEEGDLLVFLISCVDQLWDFLVLLICVHSLAGNK